MGSKPSAAFAEDELAIMVLGGESVEAPAVKGGGAVAVLVGGDERSLCGFSN